MSGNTSINKPETITYQKEIRTWKQKLIKKVGIKLMFLNKMIFICFHIP